MTTKALGYVRCSTQEQVVIRQIETMRSEGMNASRIAEALTAEWVPTKTGRSARWTHQAVRRILARAG